MFLRVIYPSAQRLYLLLRQSLMGGKNGLHSCFRVDQSEPVKRAIPECQRSILKSATLAVSGESLPRFLNQLIALETPPDGLYVPAMDPVLWLTGKVCCERCA
jgi:hypothetical protein